MSSTESPPCSMPKQPALANIVLDRLRNSLSGGRVFPARHRRSVAVHRYGADHRRRTPRPGQVRRRWLAPGAGTDSRRLGRPGSGRRRACRARLSRSDEPCRSRRICRHAAAPAQPHRTVCDGVRRTVVSRPSTLLSQRDADLGSLAGRQRRHRGLSRTIARTTRPGRCGRACCPISCPVRFLPANGWSGTASQADSRDDGRAASALLLDEATADRPVAISGGHVIALRRFRADVSTAAARLATAGCRSGLVACDDAYWAAVGLFALAHSGAADDPFPQRICRPR